MFGFHSPRIIEVPIFSVNRNSDHHRLSDNDLCHILPMTPGARIAAEREAQNIGQNELASKAKISQSALSDIESGATKRPRGDKLMSICRVLRLNPDYVITGNGPKYFDWDFPINDWVELSGEDKAAILRHMQALKSSAPAAKGIIKNMPIQLSRRKKSEK